MVGLPDFFFKRIVYITNNGAMNVFLVHGFFVSNVLPFNASIFLFETQK